MFEKSALPLLQQLVLGYNVTIMAYGPTGSGKSYTLGSSNSEVRTLCKKNCMCHSKVSPNLL